MAVIRVFKYFAIASLFNLISGSIAKQYLRNNAPVSLFDLLQRNDVDIKRVDYNEAEDIVKSIVKHNRMNNDRPKIIPLTKNLSPDYVLESNKINENVNNYVKENLLEDLLSDNGKINGVISPDYELEIELPKNSDRKFKKVLQSVIPPDHELVTLERLQELIPPDHELIKNRDIPPDHELVRNGNLQVLIPPDHELVRNEKLQVLIPPDHELVRNEKLQDFIPPDHELVNGKLQMLIPPDHEFVRHGKLKGQQGLLDYDFIKNINISPEIKSLLSANYQLADNYGRPNLYLDNLSDDTNELKKLLAKRLVLSNNELPLIEDDPKNNAYFKPLIRLPTRHPMKVKSDDDDDDLILIRSPNNEDVFSKFGLYDQPYTNKKKNYAKQYRPLSYQEEKKTTNLMKHIEYLVTKLKSPVLKKLALVKIMDVLRMMDNLREGSPPEPPAPGDLKPAKPAPLSSYVPFFNYWTYQKEIVEDDCPQDSVKIGNVCSRTPPH